MIPTNISSFAEKMNLSHLISLPSEEWRRVAQAWKQSGAKIGESLNNLAQARPEQLGRTADPLGPRLFRGNKHSRVERTVRLNLQGALQSLRKHSTPIVALGAQFDLRLHQAEPEVRFRLEVLQRSRGYYLARKAIGRYPLEGVPGNAPAIKDRWELVPNGIDFKLTQSAINNHLRAYRRLRPAIEAGLQKIWNAFFGPLENKSAHEDTYGGGDDSYEYC
jgi:hypothetical protein